MVELPLDKQPQGEREDLENDHKGTTLALAHVATFQQCARSLAGVRCSSWRVDRG